MHHAPGTLLASALSSHDTHKGGVVVLHVSPLTFLAPSDYILGLGTDRLVVMFREIKVAVCMPMMPAKCDAFNAIPSILIFRLSHVIHIVRFLLVFDPVFLASMEVWHLLYV